MMCSCCKYLYYRVRPCAHAEVLRIFVGSSVRQWFCKLDSSAQGAWTPGDTTVAKAMFRDRSDHVCFPFSGVGLAFCERFVKMCEAKCMDRCRVFVAGCIPQAFRTYQVVIISWVHHWLGGRAGTHRPSPTNNDLRLRTHCWGGHV